MHSSIDSIGQNIKSFGIFDTDTKNEVSVGTSFIVTIMLSSGNKTANIYIKKLV